MRDDLYQKIARNFYGIIMRACDHNYYMIIYCYINCSACACTDSAAQSDCRSVVTRFDLGACARPCHGGGPAG